MVERFPPSFLDVSFSWFSFLSFLITAHFPTAAWQCPHAHRGILFGSDLGTWGESVSRAEAGVGEPAVTAHSTGVKPVTPSSAYG